MNVQFDIGYHAMLTREANDACDNLLDEDQINYVVQVDVAQDLLQTQSMVHFDNCDFPGGVGHIQDEWALIEAAAAQYSEAALTAFGALLHTTQDFYAHSNWIELHTSQAPVPVWDQRLDSLPSDIVSGTWWLGSPKLCGPNAPTHSEINKDSPTSTEGKKTVDSGPNAGRTLFDLAYATALAATIVQFKRLAALQLGPAQGRLMASLDTLDAPLRSIRALREAKGH